MEGGAIVGGNGGAPGPEGPELLLDEPPGPPPLGGGPVGPLGGPLGGPPGFPPGGPPLLLLLLLPPLFRPWGVLDIGGGPGIPLLGGMLPGGGPPC